MNFYDDFPELNEPPADYLGELAAKNDALFAARRRDDRGALVVIDPIAAEVWLASERADETREYDPREA